LNRFAALGLIAEANLPSTWLGACQPAREDFDRLIALGFRHLVSAHGEPFMRASASEHPRIGNSARAELCAYDHHA
jgi:hypothetical protein